MSARTPLLFVVRALCNDQHEPGACTYPNCDCPPMMQTEYILCAAKAAITVLEIAGMLKDEDDAP